MRLGAVPNFLSHSVRRVIAAWEGWGCDHGIPRASDIRLADLDQLQARVALIELTPEREFLIRHAGGALETALIGKNFLDFTAPEDREKRAWRLRQVVEQPCGMWFLGADPHSPFAMRPAVHGVCLPLAGAPPCIIAGLFLGGAKAAPPQALETPVPLADEIGFIDLGFGVPSQAE